MYYQDLDFYFWLDIYDNYDGGDLRDITMTILFAMNQPVESWVARMSAFWAASGPVVGPAKCVTKMYSCWRSNVWATVVIPNKPNAVNAVNESDGRGRHHEEHNCKSLQDAQSHARAK